MSERPVIPLGNVDIARGLRGMGLRRGDGVMVHASMRAVGNTIAGARTVIEALIDVVGPKGIIAMPAFSSDALMPRLGANLGDEVRATVEAQVPGFDVARSSAHRMGALAEAFRQWPGTHRSQHPIRSITAYGAGSSDVVDRHPRDWPLGLEGPMGRLAERHEMKILLLGVGYERCSALHTAETIATSRRLCVRHFKDVRHQPPRWVHARDVAEDAEGYFPQVGAAFEKTGAVRLGRVGAAEARVMPFCDLLAFAAPWLTTRNTAQNAQTAKVSGRPSELGPAG